MDSQDPDHAQHIFAVQKGHALADAKPDQRHPEMGANGQTAAVVFGIGPVIEYPGLWPSSLDREADTDGCVDGQIALLRLGARLEKNNA
jgi:hypothetical protein